MFWCKLSSLTFRRCQLTHTCHHRLRFRTTDLHRRRTVHRFHTHRRTSVVPTGTRWVMGLARFPQCVFLHYLFRTVRFHTSRSGTARTHTNRFHTWHVCTKRSGKKERKKEGRKERRKRRKEGREGRRKLRKEEEERKKERKYGAETQIVEIHDAVSSGAEHKVWNATVQKHTVQKCGAQ